MILGPGSQADLPRIEDVPTGASRRALANAGQRQIEARDLREVRSRGLKLPAPATSFTAVAETDAKILTHESQPMHAGLGYSFTPGGLLFPYYTGVIAALRDLDLLGPDTPVSGCSAGAIAVSQIASGLDTEAAMEEGLRFHMQMLEKGVIWKIADMLLDTLLNILPDDVHRRAAGRLGIAVTKRSEDRWAPFEGHVIDEFLNKEDFVLGVVASCYIPYYLGPDLGLPWRGDVYWDGMLTNFFPRLPEAAQKETQRTILVSALPKTNRSFLEDPGVDICPDLRSPLHRYSTLGYIKNGLFPCSLEEHQKMCSDGYSDAKQWGEMFLEQRAQDLELKM